MTNPLTKADVVNNLTSSAVDVPLSACQGKVLVENLNNKILKIEKTYLPSFNLSANNYAAYTYSDFKGDKSGYELLSTDAEVDKDLILTSHHYLSDGNLRVSFFNTYGAEQTVGIVTIRQVWRKL